MMNDDELLAQRIRSELSQVASLTEKKMFGGVGFLIRGNMACGINKGRLIVRVGQENDEKALAKPYTRPFDFSGKPMAGWVMVDPGGYDSGEELKNWIKLAVAFTLTLPAK